MENRPPLRWHIVKGRLWQVLPVPKPIVDALMRQGLPFHVAAALVLRRQIRFGGGEKEFDVYRDVLAERGLL